MEKDGGGGETQERGKNACEEEGVNDITTEETQMQFLKVLTKLKKL